MSGMTLEQLGGLSWSWQGPREVQDEAGTHYELRIAELPDFFVAGETREEVLEEAVSALRAFLRSYVERDELPPLPANRFWVFFTRNQRPEGSPAGSTAPGYQAVEKLPVPA